MQDTNWLSECDHALTSADQYKEKCGLGYKEEESENKDYSDRESDEEDPRIKDVLDYLALQLN